MRKIPSPAQLAANRRNAQKSTGPKSANGKDVSKMNVLKHGVLAQTVVVRGQNVKESLNDFKKLCREFYESLAPAGPLEEMLVDQIVQATWRMRRARTAESGEIALSVDGGCGERECRNPSQQVIIDLNFPETPFSELLATQLTRSAFGCHYFIYVLRKLRERVDREGELTEAALNDFKLSLRNRSDERVIRLEKFRSSRMDTAGNSGAATEREQHKNEVDNYLNQEIQHFGWLEEKRDERERAVEQARQAAAVLPSEATLEKILRYETALERQLYRAMNQLERLQRRRAGENIPAPLTVDIGVKV